MPGAQIRLRCLEPFALANGGSVQVHHAQAVAGRGLAQAVNEVDTKWNWALLWFTVPQGPLRDRLSPYSFPCAAGLSGTGRCSPVRFQQSASTKARFY